MASKGPIHGEGPQIYLAGPLGFSPEMIKYRSSITKRLVHDMRLTVWDPWGVDYDEDMRLAGKIDSYANRLSAYHRVAQLIGKSNELGLRSSSFILAVLDGAEVDSGTASEVGFAAALGKVVYGLRTDFRDTGDLPGCPFNIQVLHWIESSGGKLFRSIESIVI